MAEMCRKLETEEEKVLPFFSPSLTSDEAEQVVNVEGEQPFEELSKVIKYILYMFVHLTPSCFIGTTPIFKFGEFLEALQ